MMVHLSDKEPYLEWTSCGASRSNHVVTSEELDEVTCRRCMKTLHFRWLRLRKQRAEILEQFERKQKLPLVTRKKRGLTLV